MRASLACLCTVLLLTACSGGNEQADKAKTDATAAKPGGMPIRVKPGLWETKITFTSIEAKGLPEAARAQMLKAMGKGVTIKSCLTKEQAEKPGAEFFGSAKGSNCNVGSIDVVGSTATVAMSCKPDGKTVIDSNMRGKFSDARYKMVVNQETRGTPMGDLVSAGNVEGKWLGECRPEKENG